MTWFCVIALKKRYRVAKLEKCKLGQSLVQKHDDKIYVTVEGVNVKCPGLVKQDT